jgi:hypothetical protein
MRRYSILHIPVMSFFSRELYRDVGLYWRGTCLGYLFGLLAVCWIIPMVQFHLAISDFVKDEAPKMISQIPTLTIKDGEASIEEPQPYYIKAPDSNEVLIVIDTTGTITSPTDANAFGLVTKTGLTLKEDDTQSRTFSFREIKDFKLNQAKINGWVNTFWFITKWLMYPFVLGGSYVYRIIQALIYAAIGMLFASSCKTQIGYQALLRLAVVAVTPAIIFKTIVDIVGVGFSGVGLLYFGMTMAYLFIGVKAVAEAQQPAQESEIGPPPGQFHSQP